MPASCHCAAQLYRKLWVSLHCVNEHTYCTVDIQHACMRKQISWALL